MLITKSSRNIKSSIIDSKKKGYLRLSLNSEDFLFTQVTIVSSVMLEENSDFLIKPSTSKYVNINGDTWSNSSLNSSYLSFIGAYNYMNHEQIPDKAVGFVADSLLRRIQVCNDDGDFIFYNDILIATSRDFTNLVKKISIGKIQFLSMGCESAISTCSKCGFKLREEHDSCDCLSFNKNKSFIDDKGKKRIIAEILGNRDKNSVKFIEASWLTSPPAFHGAVKRNILKAPKNSTVLIDLPSSYVEKDAIQRFVR